MAFTLKPLPYPKDSLDPMMSARTLEHHHDKHHATYVTKLNDFVKGTKFENSDLESIIRATANASGTEKKIFNNAAQVWNHTFFWNSMKPKGGGKPTGDIAKKIDDDLGGYDKFVEQFKQAATTQFGSGWAWLVLENGKLKVTKTGNADLPMVHGQTALLTLDVWEHAYYLDYQNRRPDFVAAFLEHLVNWDFANQNLAKAG